ncbi:MAG: NDMA-dependent alcohol dehydrogenase [Actinomycetota bacterium]
MKTKAAILRERNQPWSVEEIELDPPKTGEVLVQLKASGMCHSDEHLVTGDLAGATPEPPLIGGHEGAGVVLEVGDGVYSVEPGDHVVFGFIPACGRCPSCASGHSNLCDIGGEAMPAGTQIADMTARHHTADGDDIGLMCLVGSFAHHTVVNEASVVKIDPDIPLDRACLLGCGVVTGWGSSVYAAEVGPGDMVAVVGIGGIGSNAVQGAKLAGARVVAAIDPVEFKREKAMEFGATHTYSSIGEAMEDLGESTWGRGFDKVVMAMGVGDGDALGEAFHLAGKRGKIVVTNIHPTVEASMAVPGTFLTLFEKQLVGSLFGSANIRKDIPQLLELYTQGQLDLDGLVTNTYTLDEINEGFQDMRDNKNIRGVLIYD